MDLIKTINLSKTFNKKNAVDNVSLTIKSGNVYGLLGPNGSGKSTWMKLVAGLFYKSNGEINAFGEPLSISSKASIAYMPTESYFYDYMTIAHAKQFFIDFYFDFDANKFDQLLSRMQLTEDLLINTLSSGMNAKLRVALTMSRKAKVYMLDEPLNGIDLVARDTILSTIIEQANDENAIIISSHLINTMETVLDEVIFIKDGSIVLSDNAENAREQYQKSIVDLYKEVFSC